MTAEFQKPSLRAKVFTCPFCGVYSQMRWDSSDYPEDLNTATCSCCGKYSIWVGGKKVPVGAILSPTLASLQSELEQRQPPPESKMVYPLTTMVPPVNPDIPQKFAEIYNEAATIFSLSPKGAAALLRLCLQKVCNHLTGNTNAKINDNINALQKTKYISDTLIQMAHTLRVMGNEAVHPGEIDFNDTPEITYKLFGFINFFIDATLSNEKKIQDFFESQSPAIQRKIKSTMPPQKED